MPPSTLSKGVAGLIKAELKGPLFHSQVIFLEVQTMLYVAMALEHPPTTAKMLAGD